MFHRHRSPLGTVLLALSTVVATGAGTAGAQIPGALDSGTVVITDSARLLVDVDAATASAVAVTGRIRNTTSATFDCHTPGVQGLKYPGQVTEAPIVARSVRYYSDNIYTPVGGFSPEVTGITLDPMPIGSLLDILPTGSSNRTLGTTRSELTDIRTAQESARVAGHTGDPAVNGAIAFTVGSGATVTWTAPLGAPASGIRTDFQAGALFYCTETSTSPTRAYVFAGYEGGRAPAL